MTFVIDLSELILPVQVSLSDLPDTYATDEQIYFDLKSAYSYIMEILSNDAEESLTRQAVTAVGAYFTYLNYTSLAERKLGEIPQSMQLKIEALRKKALMFVKRITDLNIDEDLSISDEVETKTFTMATVVMGSFLD